MNVNRSFFKPQDPNYYPLISKIQGFNVEDGFETFPVTMSEEDFQDLVEFDKDIPVFQKFLYGKRMKVLDFFFLLLVRTNEFV